MRIFVWAIVPLVLIFAFASSYSFADFHIDETILTWSQANYKITNGTGIATIIVNDNDKNEIPFFAEKVNVFVYSDSFLEGITIDLYETEKDSGQFERTFSFSDSRSAPNILLAREGDTAIAVYTDEPLPPDFQDQTINFTATALIGSTGPPLERAPVRSPRISDLDHNIITHPSVGQQILLTSDISNDQNSIQNFVWIAQIMDKDKKTKALSWIDGTLNAQSSFSPTTSWIPENPGDYQAVFFVWESLTNPTALSPPIELDFVVSGEKSIFPIPDDDLLCTGTKLCLKEKVVRIVDGDTIYISGGHEVRLSLTNTPEIYQKGFHEATEFTSDLCPIGSNVIVDQDDQQPYDIYGRLLGKVSCQNKILNSELLDAGHANILAQYCTTSEFSDESWAQKYGC